MRVIKSTLISPHMKKCHWIVLVFLSSLSLCFAQFKTKSVLATGNWYKMSITQSGIYKIDYALLKSMGINPDIIEPKNIKIYGNGGGMLAQNISSERLDDLTENAVYLKGQEDGKFDPSDYIIFYGQGPHTWAYDNSSDLYKHTQNIYSDFAYYFITVSDSIGKRVNKSVDVCEGLNTVGLFEFDDYTFFEPDKVNILASGREWFDNPFTNNSTTTKNLASFNFAGIQPNSKFNMVVNAAVKPAIGGNTSFSYYINNNLIGTQTISNNRGCTLCNIANQTSNTFTTQIASGDNLSVSVAFDKKSDANASGYFNYFELNLVRKLQLYGSQTAFRSTSSLVNNYLNFNAANFSAGTIIWDVTSITSPFIISPNCVSTQKNMRQWIAFTSDNVTLVPTFVEKIANQNLHGLATPSFLIVTNSILLEQANRLAKFRIQKGISTEVVTVEQIYNEFSSGAQDVTAIRDFARMLYLRGNFENLLLFGACSYDYKNRILNNNNLVPTYQSRESLHDIYSMNSEDYFAFFGNKEGDWLENGDAVYDNKMKIGVGRIPVSTTSDAKAVVDKLINYNSSASFGKWRNKITLMADNGDYDLHINDADSLSNYLNANEPTYNLEKVYLDSYPLLSSPSGQKSPAAVSALKNIVNQGTVILNYSGHGGNLILAQEKLIEMPFVKTWQNSNFLPFLMTATCDFSTYDNPAIVSAGVGMLIQAKTGGIGLISATRPVFSNTNFLLNASFYKAILSKNNVGEYQDLGAIFKETKNQSVSGTSNRNYTLLADPSMKFVFPNKKIILESINGKSINTFTDTLNALSYISITGSVLNPNSTTTATNFNGTLFCDIFDKPVTFNTLGQFSDSPSPVFSYKLQTSLLYTGKSTVKNGKFSLSFILPKDINYLIGNGKISLYAYDPTNLLDASGYNNKIKIGGSNALALNDTTPPSIQIYLNDTTFKDGQFATSSSTLIAKLFDENGINVSRSGIGHEIYTWIDEDRENGIILNQYLDTKANDYRYGNIAYLLENLPSGNHTLHLTAWDTYNNSATASLNFKISSSNQLVISEIKAVPNPAKDFTSFIISHNKPGENISVEINIFDVMGKLVQTLRQSYTNSSSSIQLDYQINSDQAYNLVPGMYVYKCTVTSTSESSDRSSAQSIQKLVLID
jgi:hypothetical protein